MGYRRFAPLMALVALGLLVIGASLFKIQILEHDIWANEAANLVRAGQIVPHSRGRILDRNGVELVRDEEVYQLDFCYRDFRRGHPLGQIAHARSALEAHPIPLEAALAHGPAWMVDLVALSPRALADFAAGAELSTPTFFSASTRDPEREHRARRASDLRFYIGRLLHFTPEEWRALRDAKRRGIDGHSFLELASWLRGGRPAQELLAELELRWENALLDLGRLADALAAPRMHAADGSSPLEELPLEELIGDIETWRSRVEDSSADRLFLEAAGFDAGRLHPELVLEAIDLDWLRAWMRWDDERCAQWVETARQRWLLWRKVWAVPSIAAEVRSLEEGDVGAEHVLDQLSLFFADPAELERKRARGPSPSWRNTESLAAIGSLAQVLEIARSAEQPLVLPFQSPSLRRVALTPDRAWRLLGATLLWQPGDASFDLDRADVIEEGDRWLEHARGGSDREDLVLAITSVLDRWEGYLQGRCDEVLAAWRRNERGSASARGRLSLRTDRIDRAAERARFVFKDIESRPIRVELAPDYGLVRLIARYPERLSGFFVSRARLRVSVQRDENGVPLAESLIGRVRRAGVDELHGQRRMALELTRLQRKGTRTPDEDRLLEELVRQVYQPEELYGGSGIEGYFDPELRGRNGYEEQRGLQEQEATGRAREWRVPPVDGKDLVLTLDAELQRAAESVLEHPQGDPDPAQRDETWLADPVGAIVLIGIDGEVLAAASAPGRITPHSSAWADSTRRRERERALVRERTLLIPDFQPVGSVFKPFVAGWALDHAGFDPRTRYRCEALEDGRAGYGSVHCWRESGHGEVDLYEALRGSCNSYFAHLGEVLGEHQYAAVCRAFGFGLPSGVKLFGPRSGLPEHTADRVLRQRLTEFERRLAANGLSVIQATPMQLARAFAGLAAGSLPSLTLVRRIGSSEPPARPAQRIDLSRETLEFLREALIAVVNEPGGTAHDRGLDPLTLGFTFAAKTGSADLPESIEGEEHGVRKHTWTAGWFPAEHPRACLVVFCYDTTRTASHTSVWIAQQFLASEAVANYIHGRDGAQ